MNIPMNRVIYVSLCMVLLIMAVCPACSQPAQPTTPAKPATPAEAPKAPIANPAYTAVPPAQPQQPAVQPPQHVERPTSFQSVLYSDDKYDFSIKYPKGWIKKEVWNDIVFWASRSEEVDTDSIYICVVTKTADYANLIKECLSKYPNTQGFNGKITEDPGAAITLADGKTQAFEAKLSRQILTYDISSYGLALDKGANTIVVMGVTTGGQKQQDLLKEIAQTITLK